jgi:DNA-binding IclR family transcriptional regulator
MAIDIETFEGTPTEELGEPTNPERVLRFLLANDDQAFKAAEIVEGADVNRNSISTVLARLEERELVRHKGEYWAIGETERIRSFGRYQRATERLNEQFGPEDREEWRKHAPDETKSDSRDG